MYSFSERERDKTLVEEGHIIFHFVSLLSAASFPGPLEQKHHGTRTGFLLFTTGPPMLKEGPHLCHR